MRRALSVHEKVAIGIAVAVGLCTGTDRAVSCRNRYFRSLDERIAMSSLELRRARGVLELKNSIEDDEAEFGLGRDFDKLKDAAGLMSALDAMARESGVNVTSLRPGVGDDVEAVAFVFKGSWKSVAQFFSSAQARPHYCDISELRIVRRDPYQQELEVEGVLSRIAIRK